MRTTNPPKPMLARSPDSTDSGFVSVLDRAREGKRVPDRRAGIGMESARALAERIGAKLRDRPRLEDSTEIVRSFRDG